MFSSRINDVSVPVSVPPDSEDMYNVAISDILHRLKETIFGVYGKKGTRGEASSFIIPLDPVLPVLVKKSPVNFAEIQSNIREISNGLVVSSADPNMLWALDTLIQKLFENKKITILERPTYYCDYCRTNLSNRDVFYTTGDVKYLYGKVKISEKTYFINIGPEETVLNITGININPKDDFVVQMQGDETWIMNSTTHKKMQEKLLLFPTKFEEKKGFEIKDYFKDVPILMNEKMPTRFISSIVNSYDFQIMEKREKIDVEIIDHEVFEGSVPHCKYCGRRVRRKLTKGVYLKFDRLNFNIHPKKFEKGLNFSNILISKDFKSFPKMPILQCEKCGEYEYGHGEKMHTCGGKMTQVFSYDPSILSVGIFAFTQSYANRLYISHKSIKNRYPMLSLLSSLNMNYVKDVYISYLKLKDIEHYSEYSRSILRLASCWKKSGILNINDIIIAKKMVKNLLNLWNYVKIYGLDEKEDGIDTWIFSVIESYKKSLLDLYERGDVVKITKSYFELNNKISNYYVKLKRGRGINKELFREFLLLSYPFLPNNVMEISLNLRLNLGKIEIGLHDINKSIEKIMDDIFLLNSLIYKKKIELGIHASLPIKKIVVECDEKYHPFLEKIKDTLKDYFHADEIVFTSAWNEMEYRVKIIEEKMGEIYRPLARRIETILGNQDPRKLKEIIEKEGYNLAIEGNLITITPSMVKFELNIPKDYYMFQMDILRVYAKIVYDEESEKKMFLNRIVRRIEKMRKELNLDYNDLIDVSLSDSRILKGIINPENEKFMKKIRGRNLIFTDQFNSMLVHSFEDIMEGTIEIGITPLYKKEKMKALRKLPGIDESDAEKLFNSGYVSIKEIKMADPKEISEKTNIPISKIKAVKDYLSANESFEVIKVDEKFYCPLCESEVDLYQPFCPKCSAPLKW